MKLKIKSLKSGDNSTEITLEDGSKVKLRPFIYVRIGDVLEFLPSVDCFDRVNKIFVDRATGKTESVMVHPPYYAKDTIYLAPHKFDILFRERLNTRDWEDNVRELEQFHYRGKGLNKLVGRRTVLLAEIDGYGIVGFGVLAATVAATRPRFKLLNISFKEQMKTGLINQLIRIPRVVIHPEFRGMNIGVLMVRHLIEYAKTYWDINHYKPIMIEVIAAMIEYHKFFQKAGFVEAGNTLGYQKKGMKPKYGSGTFEIRENHETYDFIQNQKSKPYLVYPLTSEIKKKTKAIESSNNDSSPSLLPKCPILTLPIIFRDVSVKFRVKNGSTKRTEIVKEAFGIEAEHAFSQIFRGFSLLIEPGDVVLITGASGSGKSTIIRLLTSDPSILEEELELNGVFSNQYVEDIAVLDIATRSSLPLIDQIKKGGDLKEAIKLLNSVGLSEAHLYIKLTSQISDGQRYRFAVAKLCDSGKPLWIADEFASALNPEMAAIVAKGLRKMAYTQGSTLILAAPHIHHFVGSLLPNKIVKLKWGAKPVIYSLKLDNWAQDEDQVSLTVENNGSLALTDIKVGFIQMNGYFTHRMNIDTILPKKKVTANINIRDKEITAVVVKTQEKIGEILYTRMQQ